MFIFNDMKALRNITLAISVIGAAIFTLLSVIYIFSFSFDSFSTIVLSVILLFYISCFLLMRKYNFYENKTHLCLAFIASLIPPILFIVALIISTNQFEGV